MAEQVVGLDRLAGTTDADLSAMLLIRHFECTLLDLFGRGLVSGTTHTCLGQEYVPVAVNTLLGPRDYVFSNHRGHGHYLARFDDPEGLLAEILGRHGGLCAGVGGSQHLRRDRYLSTGVQGESLPVAAGVALHLQRQEPGARSVVYVGDGTWGEGAVYETLNLAALWRLPLVVVVENNGIAQSTPTTATLAGTIRDRAAAFGVGHVLVTSLDVTAIRAQLAPLPTDRPLVVEFVTHRLGPHSKGDDTRDQATLAALPDWRRRYVLDHAEQFRRLDAAARDRMEQVVADVLARPLSDWRP